jgi:tetratricopeptide (TPR) repeat protein
MVAEHSTILFSRNRLYHYQRTRPLTRLDKCAVPEDLAELQWIDLFEKSGWAQLEASIRRQTKRMGFAPPSKPTKPRRTGTAKPVEEEGSASAQTRRIIGRETEIRAIRRAIEDGKTQQVLMFVGLGGIGKTRLLQEVGSIITGLTKRVRWSKVIDVYHPEAHSDLGIRDQIIAGLDPSNKYFRTYRAKVRDYRQHLAEGFGGKILESERSKLDEVFLADYQKIAKDYRIILTFDTLELIEYEADIVQEICQIETETTTLKNWLLTEIPRLPNTVTILGGRPQKQRLSAASQVEYQDAKIWAEFEAGFAKEGIFNPGDKYELDEFTEEEAEQYYEDLAKQNPHLYYEVPRMDLQGIWTRTERRPIRLSLVIDLVLHGSIQPLYDVKPGEKPNIDDQLIEMLMGLDSPGKEVLLYLAAARKGINAALMHYLEPGRSEKEWARRLESIKKLAFIKSRPNTDLIFLHDELYELFERKSELSERRTARHYYNRIADYYRRQLEESDKKLRELGEECFKERESCRQERQEIMLSLLHYELQRDPKEGFERVFAHWDDEAIEGHEIDFDNRLRDELWRFLGSPVAQLPMVKEKINLDEINRDSAVRWVRRYLAREDFGKARQVAENILASKHLLFQADDPLFRGDLLCAYGEASLYVEASPGKTVETLNQVVGLLGNGSPVADRDPWRRNRILGRAYNDLGYYWSKAGSGTKTIDAFRRAIPYQKDMPIEHANSLNNLAYNLAKLGRVDLAQLYIEEAIKLRKELGLQFLLALSYNVQGYIHVCADHPMWGMDSCEKALKMFRRLGDTRGIGLASIGLGFACRKRADQWKLGVYPPREAERYFAQAEKSLKDAKEIFDQLIHEPFELWEAYNELGSTYCDWGFLLSEMHDKSQADAKWNLSVESQEKALGVARENHLALAEIDSLDDLAQVCRDKGDLQQAEDWLSQIVKLIPQEYWLVKGRGFLEVAEPDEGYWLALGKLHLQRGIWAIRDFVDASDAITCNV